MKDSSRIKHVSDVGMDNRNLDVRKPLKISRDEQRRFVRLNISSPMSLKSIKDSLGNYHPEGAEYAIEGVILNISAGGVLTELEQPLSEGDIVGMQFSLEEVEPLQGILGLVKRTEKDEDSYIVGIQFVNRRDLSDILSEAELDLLAAEFGHFEESVQKVLSRYLYSKS